LLLRTSCSFGFVVTSSVSIAALLPVFCYPIVPSVAVMLVAERIGPRCAWRAGNAPETTTAALAGVPFAPA
jgi:hypothetical protein